MLANREQIDPISNPQTATPQVMPLSSPTQPIQKSSIILDPPAQITLVYPNVSLISGVEQSTQVE